VQPDGVVTFDSFEFDLQAGELRKRGLRMKLQPKAEAVLSLLVCNAGRIVTQEQLRQQLWPEETFGDFEHSIGVAIWKLRNVLSDRAENPRFIETIPRRGYRFIASITQIAPPPNDAKKMIAVLPFEDLGDGKDYFSDGLAEELITQIGRLNPKRLGVIARASAVRYKCSEKPLRTIAWELAVRYVATGTIRRAKARLRITAHLVRADDQSELWSESYDREVEDVIAVQVDIAERIAKALAVELLPEQQALMKRPPTRSLEAYEFYLQGRYHWSKRATPGVKVAIEYFEKAIAVDPDYALAYAGLADCYLVIGLLGEIFPAEAFGKAKQYAEQALQLNHDLAEAHSSRAFCLLQQDWDSVAAEREHTLAIKLNTNCAPAYHWYGLTLTQIGRFAEARRALEQALKFDPFSVAIQAHLGRLSYFSREFERAVAELQRAIELDRSYWPARYFLPLTKVQCGQTAEAVEDFEAMIKEREHPILLSGLAYAYGKTGKRAKSRKALDRLLAHADQRVPPYFVAFAWAGLGNADEALNYLEQAHVERHPWLFYLKSEPAFDSLRSHARFADLLQRIFPQERAMAQSASRRT
jgi:TolB-like protein/Flp pilus assembly protein TadD